jgi:anti-anti-sigma factor
MADAVLVFQLAPHRIAVVLRGEIDIALVDQLSRARAEVVRAAPNAVHLDLEQVTFFSAVGLGFLVEVFTTVSHHQATLTVSPVPRCVTRLTEALDRRTIPGTGRRRPVNEFRDAGYAARGGLWDALTAVFSSEEQDALKQTVTGAGHQRLAALPRDQGNRRASPGHPSDM